MQKERLISGFSRLSKQKKLDWICSTFLKGEESKKIFSSFWLKDEELQEIFDAFSENTISNFLMPFGVAPNFVINQEMYCVPMVIEESSVVAAASSAAKYWMNRGGFSAKTVSTTKIGQLHFEWFGNIEKLHREMPFLRILLLENAKPITINMEKRGGGICSIELKSLPQVSSGCHQLFVSFETCDSMGANFINSVLESFGQSLKNFLLTSDKFEGSEKECSIIMAILSNYTPECRVRVEVSAKLEDLGVFDGELDGAYFAEKFHKAVQIARHDPYRATTHNKGIFNGIDAVILATANDFRAIESAGHAYAAKDGQYRSLSNSSLDNNTFSFWMEIPLAIGTIGGLTKLHPLANLSLKLLGNPSAKRLMEIIASAGLAQNFAAVRSLITTGIQKGHMKMHLLNILNFLKANASQKQAAITYFNDKVVSFTDVRNFLETKTV